MDGGDPDSDWTEEFWQHGARINVGVYGGTSQASMSLSALGNIADLNHDGSVDNDDLVELSQAWLRTDAPMAEDLNRDSTVDFCDYADLISNWLWQE